MSKTSKIVIAIIVTAVWSLPVVAAAGALTDGEVAHLIFMRQEEKLARDVYLTVGEMYKDEMPVFNNIACQAEQTHTEQIDGLFDKFNKSDLDPEADTEPVDDCPDILPDNIGVFTGIFFTEEREYFLSKYNSLKDKAAVSLLDALKVGALIEELDMKDIEECNDVICDYLGEEAPCPASCGLKVTDVRALESTLGNLLAGSENHLCAFISQIGPMIAPEKICYEAQYLTQQEVLDIIADTCPEFSGYVCPLP